MPCFQKNNKRVVQPVPLCPCVPIKKVFFLVTTKKTQIFDVLSIENGGFYNYLLLVVGLYGQCAFM